VFVRGGRCLFFDWSDSCLSHPFHTPVVTMRALAHPLELAPGGPDGLHLRNALEAFGQYGSRPPIWPISPAPPARVLSWYRFVYARNAEFRSDDEEAVPYGLKRLLDLGPPGSWS
jgi:hypothetical protein